MQVTEVVIEEVDLLEEIRKLDTKDNKVIKAIEEIKQTGVKILRDKEWREENGLMLRNGNVRMDLGWVFTQLMRIEREELNRVPHVISLLLIYILHGLCTNVSIATWPSRMFYNHLTMSYITFLCYL